MNRYVATRMIDAMPMTRGAFVAYVSLAHPQIERSEEEGYLIEYPELPSNHLAHAGYIIWCNKPTFERTYAFVGPCKHPMGSITDKEPWQQSVIAERAQLSQRLNALADQIGQPGYKRLSIRTQELLERQFRVMCQYDEILQDRIAAF